MPSPGAPIPTGFIYVEVTRDLIRQKTPTFGPFASIQPYTEIEQYISGRGIFSAELRDFIDGSRTYRLPNTSLGQFPIAPFTVADRFIPVGAVRIPILLTDPTVGKASRTEFWKPM